MAIDLFEGSRRLARVITVLVTLLIASSVFFGQSNLSQHIRIDKPGDLPVAKDDCSAKDYSRWIGDKSAGWGLSYARFICVAQEKNIGGETMGIAIQRQDGRLFFNSPYSEPGRKYIDDLAKSSLLEGVLPPSRIELLKHFLGQLGWAFLAGLVTALVATSLFKLVGWVARGFLAK